MFFTLMVFYLLKMWFYRMGRVERKEESVLLGEYYAKELLRLAEPCFMFEKFGCPLKRKWYIRFWRWMWDIEETNERYMQKPLPVNKGKTILFRRYEKLPKFGYIRGKREEEGR